MTIWSKLWSRINVNFKISLKYVVLGSPYVQQTHKCYTIFITCCWKTSEKLIIQQFLCRRDRSINASIPDLPYSPTPASSPFCYYAHSEIQWGHCKRITANVSSIFDTMLTHELPVTKEVNLGPVNISGPLRKPYRTMAFCLHMKRCRSDAIWPVPDRCVCRDTSMVFTMARKPIRHGFSNAQPYRRQPRSVRSFALFNWFWNVLSWMVLDIQAERQSQKASAFNVFPHALWWHLLRTILYSTWQVIPCLMYNIAVQGINQNLAILFGAYCSCAKRNETKWRKRK